MNKVQLMGRLVRDPELKVTTGGKSYARFTLAIDYAKDSEGNKLTNFVPCMAWEKRAEVIEKYFAKGQRMLVTNAMLMVRSYVDEEGNNRSYTYVNVSDFEFVETKRESEGAGAQGAQGAGFSAGQGANQGARMNGGQNMQRDSFFDSLGDVVIDF